MSRRNKNVKPKKKKINPVLSHIISALIGIFITLLFAELILPSISTKILHRNDILIAQATPPNSVSGLDKKYKSIDLILENKHKSFSLEDININFDLPDKVAKILVSADDGTFEYQISKGSSIFFIKNNQIKSAPSNYRNIKIRKMFPESIFVLKIFIDTENKGPEFSPRAGVNSKKLQFTITYSYKFLGTTVRRELTKSS